MENNKHVPVKESRKLGLSRELATDPWIADLLQALKGEDSL